MKKRRQLVSSLLNKKLILKIMNILLTLNGLKYLEDKRKTFFRYTYWKLTKSSWWGFFSHKVTEGFFIKPQNPVKRENWNNLNNINIIKLWIIKTPTMGIEFNNLEFSCFSSIPIAIHSNIHFILSLYAEAIKS